MESRRACSSHVQRDHKYLRIFFRADMGDAKATLLKSLNQTGRAQEAQGLAQRGGADVVSLLQRLDFQLRAWRQFTADDVVADLVQHDRRAGQRRRIGSF